MEIKTAVKYYQVPSTLANIKKADKIIVGNDGKQWRLSYATGGSISVLETLWKTAWYHLLKMRIIHAYNLVIL